MGEFEDFARHLEKLRSGSGGSERERQATGRLFVALLYYRFVALAKALKREDVEASAREDGSCVSLRVEGLRIEICRFDQHTSMSYSLHCFSADLVPPSGAHATTEISALPIEPLTKMADEFVGWCRHLILRDLALR